jgi:hypothetical protein
MKKIYTEQDVIDFVDFNFQFLITHDELGNELPLADVTYHLTVHDLLSAFEMAGEYCANTPNV